MPFGVCVQHYLSQLARCATCASQLVASHVAKLWVAVLISCHVSCRSVSGTEAQVTLELQQLAECTCLRLSVRCLACNTSCQLCTGHVKNHTEAPPWGHSQVDRRAITSQEW